MHPDKRLTSLSLAGVAQRATKRYLSASIGRRRFPGKCISTRSCLLTFKSNSDSGEGFELTSNDGKSRLVSSRSSEYRDNRWFQRCGSRSLGFLVTGVMILTGLTACSKDPLDISCTDFLGQSNAEQLITAAKWGHPSRDGSYTPMDEIAAGQYVQDLRTYCSASTHSDDSLNDLDFRY